MAVILSQKSNLCFVRLRRFFVYFYESNNCYHLDEISANWLKMSMFDWKALGW